MKSKLALIGLAAIFAMPAKADETLKFRAVQHATSAQSMKVDANGRTVGLARTVGMLFLPDGSVTGTVLIIGTFDSVIGVGGTIDGYSIPTFTDGSELWLKYTGTTKTDPTGKIALKGTFNVTGGKGRFAEAKGDGTFEGEQSQSVTLPGDAIAYVDNVINIKK